MQSSNYLIKIRYVDKFIYTKMRFMGLKQINVGSKLGGIVDNSNFTNKI